MGTDGADRMEGLAGIDELFGRGGDDVLLGGVGNDELFGGEGNDQLDGGEGDDFVDGRGGDDVLTGGPGRDFFAFYAADDNGADRITDFERGIDTLMLGRFAPGTVKIRQVGGDTLVEVPGRLRLTLLGVAQLDPRDVRYDVVAR
jgi:Ca2+-binding RTX toxin-like protein